MSYEQSELTRIVSILHPLLLLFFVLRNFLFLICDFERSRDSFFQVGRFAVAALRSRRRRSTFPFRSSTGTSPAEQPCRFENSHSLSFSGFGTLCDRWRFHIAVVLIIRVDLRRRNWRRDSRGRSFRFGRICLRRTMQRKKQNVVFDIATRCSGRGKRTKQDKDSVADQEKKER